MGNFLPASLSYSMEISEIEDSKIEDSKIEDSNIEDSKIEDSKIKDPKVENAEELKRIIEIFENETRKNAI